ncbi:MAG: glycoside hydrolase family 3 C-terminal domain-containing protein, partial [Ruminococcus sp.]|nr:glycoside hydrolase family 3 C-terminal domain-containing protein [Ruminococcus sp.]
MKTLDWSRYLEKAVQVASEGIVMLENNNNTLPLDKDKPVAVFGRIQLHYYKSGTGSGGMVNVSKVTGITDGLIEAGIEIDTELLDIYKKWDSLNPYDLGTGWGAEPWSQAEMPLNDEIVRKSAEKCDTAIVIIGRTAGEEQDSKVEKGSYLLTDTENDMLSKVRKEFKKVVVLLNVGGIIDMSFVDKYKPDAVLYVWQGGMTGGTGVANVMTGKISPCGKLPDTIAYRINDYHYVRDFGGKERNFYCDDIYVGHRFFETFARIA